MKLRLSSSLRIAAWLPAILLLLTACHKQANGIDPIDEVEEITTQSTDSTTQTRPEESPATPPTAPDDPGTPPTDAPAPPVAPPSEPPADPVNPPTDPTQPTNPTLPQPGKAGQLWARGVSREQGWYDVNKKKDGRGADGLLCWAASASCMLQWWMDDYERNGHSLPAGLRRGKGENYELKIFEEFMANWTNEGASAFVGCRWYLSGENVAATYSNFARLTGSAGGQLRSIYEPVSHRMGSDYARHIGGYSTWDTGSGRTEPALEIFSKLILQALSEGIVSLDINPAFSGSHAITLWGCEYNEQGIITHMYITDSDDLIDNFRAPRTPILHRFELASSPREPRVVGLLGMRYKKFVQIQTFDTLRGYPVS